jgi:hypothetical protein
MSTSLHLKSTNIITNGLALKYKYDYESLFWISIKQCL